MSRSKLQDLINVSEQILLRHNLKQIYILDIRELRKIMPKKGISPTEIAKGLNGLKISNNEYGFNYSYGPEKMARQLLAKSRELMKESGQTNSVYDKNFTKVGLSLASANTISRRFLTQNAVDHANSLIENMKNNGVTNEEINDIVGSMEILNVTDQAILTAAKTRVLSRGNNTIGYIINDPTLFQRASIVRNGVSTTQELEFTRNALQHALDDYAKEDSIRSIEEYIADQAKVIFENKTPKKQPTEKVSKKIHVKQQTFVPKLRVTRNQKFQVNNRFESTARLLSFINALITSFIRKNMGRGSHHLRYRTGRFANSVSIVGLAATREQAAHITYKYMRYPYQTFERGYAQGHLDLDPRDLIDTSIRQLMQQALGFALVSTERI